MRLASGSGTLCNCQPVFEVDATFGFGFASNMTAMTLDNVSIIIVGLYWDICDLFGIKIKEPPFQIAVISAENSWECE